MKLNIGKLFASIFRQAAPIVVPLVVGLVTAKANEVGTKVVEKATRPKV